MKHLLDNISLIEKDFFQSRNDPNDKRVGDILLSGFKEYDKANVIIIGCPQDIGVLRNQGRTGAARAP